MSHSLGAVKFKDNTIKYYEYNGTCNIVPVDIEDTSEDVFVKWRNPDYNRTCTCGNELEKVSVYSNYGNGFYTEGFACKKCNYLHVPVEFNMISPVKAKEHWAINIHEFKNK